MAYFDNAATTYPKPECVYEEWMDSIALRVQTLEEEVTS